MMNIPKHDKHNGRGRRIAKRLAAMALILLFMLSIIGCEALFAVLDVAQMLLEEGYIYYASYAGSYDQSDEVQAYEIPLDVFIIDVGQADSILLRSPSGKTMLIDAGESKNFPAIKKKLKELGITRLDVVIATHPHSDHIGGMTKVIETYDIGKFYLPDAAHATKTYENMIAALEKKPNTKVIAAAADAVSSIAWDTDVEVLILSPFADAKYKDFNNYSVVIRVKYGETSILLAGDAETAAEAVMLERLPADYFSATVLKLGHHGSTTSTSADFFAAVAPKLAVISVGEGNSYGHPGGEMLDMLKAAQTPCFRTDLNGTIYLHLDGKDVLVYCEKEG